PTLSSTSSTLSLHDALPISSRGQQPRSRIRVRLGARRVPARGYWRNGSQESCRFQPRKSCTVVWPAAGVDLSCTQPDNVDTEREDRKSTRLNSSHVSISYAV